MIELIIGILGSVVGLFLYNLILKNSAVKGQKELDKKVQNLETKVRETEKEIETQKKEAQEKIDELEKDKNKNTTTDDLVDFFNNRKGK